MISCTLYISKEDGREQLIKNSLIKNFQEYNLELVFREISTKTPNQCVEFLDVLHETTPGANKGFITKDFRKPTAINATFLNGKSTVVSP